MREKFGKYNSNKKRVLETALPENESSFKGTVISSTDGAKILTNLDSLTIEYQEKLNHSKTFLGDIAKAIGAKRNGSDSKYATFETKNGIVVTIRLSDHSSQILSILYR